MWKKFPISSLVPGNPRNLEYFEVPGGPWEKIEIEMGMKIETWKNMLYIPIPIIKTGKVFLLKKNEINDLMIYLQELCPISEPFKKAEPH